MADSSKLLEELPNKLKDNLGVVSEMNDTSGMPYLNKITAEKNTALESVPESASEIALKNASESVSETALKNTWVTLKAIQLAPQASINELGEKTSFSIRTINNHLAVLKKAGYIHRIGSKKTGYWKVNKLKDGIDELC